MAPNTHGVFGGLSWGARHPDAVEATLAKDMACKLCLQESARSGSRALRGVISTFGEKWQKTSKFVYESQARKKGRCSTGKVVGKGMAAEGLSVARPIWLDGSMKSKGTTKPFAQ